MRGVHGFQRLVFRRQGFRRRWVSVTTGLLASVSAVALPSGARADVQVTPRVELRQSFGDTTYNDFQVLTAVVPGMHVVADTKRLKGQLDYEFSRRFAWSGTLYDKGQHRLNANGQATIIRDLLNLNAGGVVTQTFRDWRGPLSTGPEQNNPNQSTVSSFYVQPTLQEEIGTIAVFDAFYRFSYNDVNNAGRLFQAGEEAPPGTAFSLAPASDSVSQDVQVALSNRTNRNSRLGWTLRGNYTADDRDDLNEELRIKSGVLDLSYSVTRKLALLGSVGYEDITDEQDNLLVDPETGFPILDDEGRLQVDPDQPRQMVMDRSGMTWDVGVRLTPSRRTQLTLRGGRQYGGTVINGDLSYQIRNGITLVAQYSESLNTFGRLFSGQLAGQPFSFMVGNNYRLGPGFIMVPTEFGLLPVPGIVTNATFKSRLGQLRLNYTTERTNANIAAYYDRRNYLNLGQAVSPDTPVAENTLAGRSDVTWGVTAGLSRQLSGSQSISGNLYYSNLKYALSRERRDSVFGGSISYNWKLMENLQASAMFNSLHRSSKGFGSSQHSNTLTLTLRATF
ncbi:hypothetical protein [Pedomonas mirosovicensis]|uniref:hypothetical protein n=1 Tax=Pedomonas mirosovicensis TaxID=2908641 RepID=UPI00216A8DB4|nr:hypothetical protein [Pedomonas mirosovicensis]MCH8684318.1 hypothetical protein [Pedomonas mirosovicensis]